MKKFLLFVCVFVVSTTVFSQSRMANMPNERIIKEVTNTAATVPVVTPSSSSTAPAIIWDDDFSNVDAAKLITQCNNQLEELENNTGKQIHLDLEAEPGCRLQTSEDVSSFVLEYFGDDETSRRYLQEI